MAGYNIEDKLVIAVASSALFDLAESDEVYRKQGDEAYRRYQRDNEDKVLQQGAAYPMVKRLLSLNDGMDSPVEVILLSQNDPDTGLRVFNSIEHWGLNIVRAAFLSGGDPFRYLDAFNACLFLSADAHNVQDAIKSGHPAGQIFPTSSGDDDSEPELRIAFDFDGVIADDSAESVNRERGLDEFQESERHEASEPHPIGPLHRFFAELAKVQRRDRETRKRDPEYKARIRISIITARSAPAHKRVVTSLRRWNVEVDETFFLGGIDKARILEEFKPHIFFDDQLRQIEETSQFVPSAHVPFGVANVVADTADAIQPDESTSRGEN